MATFTRHTMILALLIPLLNCNAATGDDTPPDDDSPDDPRTREIELHPDYYAEPSEEVIALPSGDHLRWVALNQVMLLVDDDVTASDIQDIAEGVNAAVIGQVPFLGFYQLKTNTSNLAELDAVLDELQQMTGVEEAGYNPLEQYRRQCPPSSDLEQLEGDDRCAPRDTEWYQMMVMVEAFRPHIQFAPVYVAMIDSGIHTEGGGFSQNPIIHVAQGGHGRTIDEIVDAVAWIEDDACVAKWEKGHGTAVASVIVADNDGTSPNGLASRVLGDELYFAWAPDGTASRAIVSTVQAIHVAGTFQLASETIINLSFGYSPAMDNCEEIENPTRHERRRCFTAVRTAWRRLITHFAQVLFVAAAPNDASVVLNGLNDAPAGLGLPNLLTVGGSAECKAEYAPGVATGSGVNVVAPAEKIPVLHTPDPDGKLKCSIEDDIAMPSLLTGQPSSKEQNVSGFAPGTSYAAPQVASLAAILWSMDNTQSVADIRQRILENGMGITGVYTGADRISFARSVAQLLVDLGHTTPVRLDVGTEGQADGVGTIVGRLCDSFSYTVDGLFSHHYYFDSQPEALVAILHTGNTLQIAVQDGPEDAFLTIICQECDIAPNTNFPVGEGAGTATIGFSMPPAEAGGAGKEGQLLVDGCKVLARNQNGPATVQITGRLNATLEVGGPLVGEDPELREVRADFAAPVYVSLLPDDPYLATLDEVCEDD